MARNSKSLILDEGKPPWSITPRKGADASGSHVCNRYSVESNINSHFFPDRPNGCRSTTLRNELAADTTVLTIAQTIVDADKIVGHDELETMDESFITARSTLLIWYFADWI